MAIQLHWVQKLRRP